MLSLSLFRSFSIGCGALVMVIVMVMNLYSETRWEGIIPYSIRCCFTFFFLSFFSFKKQSQVNLRSTRYCTKSFFRITYSGRPQNGRSESKHLTICAWPECGKIHAERPANYECRSCSSRQRRFVICLKSLLKTDLVLLTKRIIARQQTNLYFTIFILLYLFYFTIFVSSHPVDVENANTKRTEIEGGKTKSYPVKRMSKNLHFLLSSESDTIEVFLQWSNNNRVLHCMYRRPRKENFPLKLYGVQILKLVQIVTNLVIGVWTYSPFIILFLVSPRLVLRKAAFLFSLSMCRCHGLHYYSVVGHTSLYFLLDASDTKYLRLIFRGLSFPFISSSAIGTHSLPCCCFLGERERPWRFRLVKTICASCLPMEYYFLN